MSDTFGALAIPTVSTPDGSAAGDPFLTTSLSFFMAVLNANAPAAWRSVYHDRPSADVVKATLDNDPRDGGFNDNDLPALYFWRELVEKPIWIADDWLTQQSTCRLMWVMPAAVQAKRVLRSSIVNAIARTLLVMTERDRDPSWVDDGDPDPLAATLGSSFFGRAGWLDFEIGKWSAIDLAIPMLDRGQPPRMYDALSIACTVTERLVPDLTRFDQLAGIDATLKTPDGGVGDGGVLLGEQILT